MVSRCLVHGEESPDVLSKGLSPVNVSEKHDDQPTQHRYSHTLPTDVEYLSWAAE